MKKIINHMAYNTDSAEKIAEYESGIASDAYYFCRALYRTPKGNWFYFCEGGPFTAYGKTVLEPNGCHYTTSGCSIEPCDEMDARDFCAEYGTYKDYVSFFGEPEEA